MHIFITGASKGIGFETARAFCASGKSVELSICSRNERQLLHATAALEREFPDAKIFDQICDVSNEQDVERFAREAERNFGAVEVLINNAGFGLFKPMHEMSIEEFQSVLATNLRGVFLVSQAILPAMKTERRGTIVTVSSLAGKNGFAGGAAYSASKFGVRGLMQSLFLEVRSFDIRVITMFPGSVDTEFFVTAGHPLGERAKSALRASDVAAAIFDAVQLSNSATVSELDIRPTNPS